MLPAPETSPVQVLLRRSSLLRSVSRPALALNNLVSGLFCQVVKVPHNSLRPPAFWGRRGEQRRTSVAPGWLGCSALGNSWGCKSGRICQPY